MDKQESTQSANRAGTDGPSLDEHITLTQAAKLAPGRPTPNCVWRRASGGKLGGLRQRDMLVERWAAT